MKNKIDSDDSTRVPKSGAILSQQINCNSNA